MIYLILFIIRLLSFRLQPLTNIWVSIFKSLRCLFWKVFILFYIAKCIQLPILMLANYIGRMLVNIIGRLLLRLFRISMSKWLVFWLMSLLRKHYRLMSWGILVLINMSYLLYKMFIWDFIFLDSFFPRHVISIHSCQFINSIIKVYNLLVK